MAEATPRERAEDAAEALAAEGAAVTARAVQQRAQVGMNVASPVAREWNARQSQSRDLPPLPNSVLARINAVWGEAVEAARVEHQAERDGWVARLAEVEDERDGAIDDVTRCQEELAQAAARIAELEQALEQAQGATTQAQVNAAAAEARASSAEGVAAGLREALSALSSTIEH